MNEPTQPLTMPGKRRNNPFRGAMLRGLAVLFPPLATLLIILWAISTTKTYFIVPVTNWAREGLVWALADVRKQYPDEASAALYHRLENGEVIPRKVYQDVMESPGAPPPPATGIDYYRRYVDLNFLQPYFSIPFFLAVLALLLYFLGKFMAAGIGRFFGNSFDHLMLGVPGVRAVYSAAKQVSDFVFSERNLQVTRIVAVEYPRKGTWAMGFVTGEGLAAIHNNVEEPVLTVLIPYSPLPLTGGTVVVRKSECIDLNVTFDQACQFIISCGVVAPPSQLVHEPASDS